MNKEDQISSLLTNIKLAIQEDRLSEITPMLQTIVQKHPDWIDKRLQSEIGLIEKQIEYKTQLKDLEYYRVTRLVYQYCQKVYGVDEVCCPECEMEMESNADLPDKDVIWWCWLQGLEQAPDLVKACYHSLERLQRKIVILTDENMLDYVSFPDWILEAKDEGKIDRTHFSDLLRLELLTTRGGTWIDSTVFCTDAERISNVLEKAALFCYGSVMRDSVSECIMFDNWFIHCSKASKILTETKNMLYTYWKQESNLKHYFLFQLMFTIACKRNPVEHKSIPLYSNEPSHILQMEMFDHYDENRWKQICAMTGIHKLTYKYDQTRELKGTMLGHVLNGALVSDNLGSTYG